MLAIDAAEGVDVLEGAVVGQGGAVLAQSYLGELGYGAARLAEVLVILRRRRRACVRLRAVRRDDARVARLLVLFIARVHLLVVDKLDALVSLGVGLRLRTRRIGAILIEHDEGRARFHSDTVVVVL